ncbi:MAG TPA: glycosyltransferase N-terminal domain-containing protein, partial [Bacteroidia bacterium]|nr:glycosyltransferase N-terminal domain-containing protein [Bacteroidia bacterium]
MKKICFYTCGFVYDAIVFPAMAILYTISLLTRTLRRYVQNRSSFAKLKNLFHSHSGKGYTYFFCSSIGEFEQLIPLLSLFEKENKPCYIFFHSQNGLDHARKQGFLNAAMTSFDYFTLWTRLFRISRPAACVISKHELWPGFILATLVHSRLYIVNVVPRINHPWYTRIYRHLVFRFCARVFFAESGSSSLTNGTCTGDTRIDRIRQRS